MSVNARNNKSKDSERLLTFSRDTYALTAEARTSAMILAILPFIAGGGIFIMQRACIKLLFETPSGQSCLGAAILLMGAGLGTIQYMINNVLK